MTERDKNWEALEALVSAYERDLLSASDADIEATDDAGKGDERVRQVLARALAARTTGPVARRRGALRPRSVPGHTVPAPMREISPRRATFGSTMDHADEENDDDID